VTQKARLLLLSFGQAGATMVLIQIGALGAACSLQAAVCSLRALLSTKGLPWGCFDDAEEQLTSVMERRGLWKMSSGVVVWPARG